MITTHYKRQEVTPSERLAAIATALKNGENPEEVSVRTFLSWFAVKRRGSDKVRMVRSALRKARLATDPNFEDAYMDGPLRFVLPPAKSKVEPTRPTGAEEKVPETLPEKISLLTGAMADPTFRIGRLDAAHNRPLSVKPEAPLQTATTMMLMHGYSQLPVMTTDYTVKGMVSWRSIGMHQSLAGNVEAVKDCMEAAHEVSSEASVFSALPVIVEQDYILVRDLDNRIAGIVTASDLSVQFRQLAEPFLLIGEIENHFRRLIDNRFTINQLAKAVQPLDGRTIESVSDLTFGEYVRVFEHPDCWQKIGLKVDKVVFTRQLERIRQLRNEIMHFDPDPFEEADLITLRSFAEFLRRLGLDSVTA